MLKYKGLNENSYQNSDIDSNKLINRDSISEGGNIDYWDGDAEIGALSRQGSHDSSSSNNTWPTEAGSYCGFASQDSLEKDSAEDFKDKGAEACPHSRSASPYAVYFASPENSDESFFLADAKVVSRSYDSRISLDESEVSAGGSLVKDSCKQDDAFANAVAYPDITIPSLDKSEVSATYALLKYQVSEDIDTETDSSLAQEQTRGAERNAAEEAEADRVAQEEAATKIESVFRILKAKKKVEEVRAEVAEEQAKEEAARVEEQTRGAERNAAEKAETDRAAADSISSIAQSLVPFITANYNQTDKINDNSGNWEHNRNSLSIKYTGGYFGQIWINEQTKQIAFVSSGTKLDCSKSLNFYAIFAILKDALNDIQLAFGYALTQFKCGSLKLWEEFMNSDRIKSLENNGSLKDYSVIFTGHSLGAALADATCLAAKIINPDKFKDISSITFENPGTKLLLQNLVSQLPEHESVELDKLRFNFTVINNKPNCINTSFEQFGDVYVNSYDNYHKAKLQLHRQNQLSPNISIETLDSKNKPWYHKIPNAISKKIPHAEDIMHNIRDTIEELFYNHSDGRLQNILISEHPENWGHRISGAVYKRYSSLHKMASKTLEHTPTFILENMSFYDKLVSDLKIIEWTKGNLEYARIIVSEAKEIICNIPSVGEFTEACREILGQVEELKEDFIDIVYPNVYSD
ncbi:MAG: hypothetical protein SFT68_03660 [Rickettsiaceae bacterium]|nr:hypothetical protein [Rickettsiaceae bacterium]